ncbi:biotin-dependent carboxyltransferase family protein [Pseudidiomarina mangrovi]|uniref:5-oxoprolinase subunit C family protein n=1 Tax=Pseudidiomarina mangrovi TaxID=2487133 RepID=UPI0013E0C3BA|nr:biotin-dependent carboxyltransferase family protein [Pseudidiomarina mangrovi]
MSNNIISHSVLRVVSAGFYTSLQDFGRFGLLAAGITRGGPVDERAFLWANRLLDNHYNAAQLEITASACRLACLAETQVCVTGAASQVVINGEPQRSWQVLTLRAGDQLEIPPPQRGLRSYLAIRGGFSATPCQGSVATVRRDRRGGIHGDGRLLADGEVLKAPLFSVELPQRRPQQELLAALISQPSTPLQLGIIASGQYQQFSDSARQLLTNQTMRVSPAHDRMGVRLQVEQPIEWAGEQLISEPLAVGAIQIPPDGQPIVMLNDRQTLGGYPKIATLSWQARCLLAQAGSGTQLQFYWQELSEAQAHWREVAQFFHLPRSG